MFFSNVWAPHVVHLIWGQICLTYAKARTNDTDREITFQFLTFPSRQIKLESKKCSNVTYDYTVTVHVGLCS